MSSANTPSAAATNVTKTRGKRVRSNTPRTSLSTSSSSSLSSPEAKVARSSTSPDRHEMPDLNNNLDHSSGISNNASPGTRPILCTLPPTCSHHPTILPNSRELERHYATYHAHVCEQPGCGCVFPEPRLLELHQTECHDPLAVVRRERGDKIFACHLTTCGRFFSAPKARRLHMIEVHKYPKEFFFAVTNKGIGGLLKKWGEGASMIRKEWKPRDKDEEKRRKRTGRKGRGKEGQNRHDGEGDKKDAKMEIDEESDSDDDSNDEENSNNEEEMDIEDIEKTPRPQTRILHPASPPRLTSASSATAFNATDTNADSNLDSLTQSMSSLSLVPPSVRFGRGGRAAGLGRGRGRGGRGGIVLPQVQAQQGQHQRSASAGGNAEHVEANSNVDSGRGSRGRGKSGRGRGGKGHHRAVMSVGSGVDIDAGSSSNGGGNRGGGGNVVLVAPGPSIGPTRGRGGRGRRGMRGTV